MYTIANDICTKNKIPFEILYPLIEETAKKVQSITPRDAQTGPAKRNDTQNNKKSFRRFKFTTAKNISIAYKNISKKANYGKKL